MPHQLEGLKLAERSRSASRRMAIAMLLAMVLSPFAAFWGALHIGYEHGAVEVWSGSVFNRTQRLVDESDACERAIVDCYGFWAAVCVLSHFGATPIFLVAPVSDWICNLRDLGSELLLVFGLYQLFHQIGDSTFRAVYGLTGMSRHSF